MIDSTGSGAVVDECAAWSAELVVEGDRGGEAEEALKDALSEAGEGSGSVALEGEDCRRRWETDPSSPVEI
jgi:hypothetical protein